LVFITQKFEQYSGVDRKMYVRKISRLRCLHLWIYVRLFPFKSYVMHAVLNL